MDDIASKHVIGNEPSEVNLFHIPSTQIDDFYKVTQIADKVEKSNRLVSLKTDHPELECLINAFENNLNPTPICSILKIIRKRYKLFCIAEHPYFDLDEWGNYAAFYAKAFKPYERVCHRIHCFEGEEDKAKDIIEGLRSGCPKDYRDITDFFESLKTEYKGFFVLRPHNNFTIGRTAIAFDSRKDPNIELDKHPLESTGYPFCTGGINNTLHLLGNKISIFAPPFIQQSPVTGVCTTASLWVASQVLASRFGLHKFPFETITRLASNRGHDEYYSGSTSKLGEGLTIPEIADAMAATGCTPHTIMPTEINNGSPQARIRLLAYTFVESGLPVIAVYHDTDKNDSHAITIVGHLLPGKDDLGDAAESIAELVYPELITHQERHHLLGMAVQLYYAHDDAYGPFNRIQFISDKEAFNTKKQEDVKPEIKTSSCLISTGRIKNPNKILNALVVPIPPYVQNHPDAIIPDAIKLMDYTFPPENDGAEDKKILWRFLLAYTPDFKRSIMQRDFPEEIRKKYLSCHLPLYVWVAEFTIIKPTEIIDEMHYKYPVSPTRMISGEFLYDSTTPFYEPNCIIMRVNNRFRDCRIEKELIKCGDDLANVTCFTPNRSK